MTRTVIQKFYQAYPSHTFDKRTWQLLLDAALSVCEPHRGGALLDVGCHNGDKTVALGKFVAANRVVGIDFMGATLKQAGDQDVQAVAIDLNQDAPLPFPNEAFDCIHLGEVIEHVFSPDLLLAEIARLLRPTGYAVITTPNLACWRNRIALPLGWQPLGTEVSTERRVGNPRAPAGPLAGHIRMFTPRALIELAGHYGLAVERIVGWAPEEPTTPLTYLFAAMDWFARTYAPTLCDGMVLKLRKARPNAPASAYAN